VADRAVPGHWEGDLIIGKRNLSAIGTLVERTTGYTMLLHLPEGYRPEQVRDALAAKIQTLPETLRGSLTWDQGPEMRDWHQVAVAAGIDIFFCDPHAPWQRGTNENTNGLLRQYFPKGSDLAVHPEAELDRVAAELNDRPANGSDSANRPNRSLTCFWLREEHPAQPPALDHISTSFLIAASPDAAPEESRWSPRSRAAARRNDLDADQRQPTIRRQGGAEPGLLNPARAAQETLHTRQLQPPWHYHRKPCVATTGRIRRSS
jgi:hypothetical protein